MVKEQHSECCMCGDHGLSSELFTCKNCRFRSQHKYCSNLYPGAESYNTCNWCLIQKDGKKVGETRATTSHKMITTVHQDDDNIKMVKKKRVLLGENSGDRKTSSNQIKKGNKLPPVEVDRRAVVAATGRRRVASDHVGGGGGRINIRRTRSEEMSSNGGNGIVIKQVFRNKVRRYKLLDDVSS